MKKKINVKWYFWFSRLVGIIVIVYGIWNYNNSMSLLKDGIRATAVIKKCSGYETITLDIEYDGHKGKLEPMPYLMKKCPKESTIEVIYSAKKPSKVIPAEQPTTAPLIGTLMIGIFLFLTSFMLSMFKLK